MAVEFLSLADCSLAYQRQVGNKNLPGIMFLSGFASDMQGTKASFIAEKAGEKGFPFVRFDYRGCGRSQGDFSKATIGSWLEDSLAVMDSLTQGPQIVVGSSMGGWVGLLIAKSRPEKVKAFIGIAPAPDFTHKLVWEKLTDEDKHALLHDGFIVDKRAPLDRQAPMTCVMIEESKNHLILDRPIEISCPVRILQGMRDQDVPWAYALEIIDRLPEENVRLTLVKGADHSLSRQEDLDLLWREIEDIAR